MNHHQGDSGGPNIGVGASQGIFTTAKLPGAHRGGTTWVTRHRPKVDRIACPWLIRRFIDRDARFLFVEPSQVLLVADRYEATAFDVEGAPFAHQGERCTFDALLDHFALRTEALDRLDAAAQSLSS